MGPVPGFGGRGSKILQDVSSQGARAGPAVSLAFLRGRCPILERLGAWDWRRLGP